MAVKGVIACFDIKVAAHSGFCFGVKQALARAKAAAENEEWPVYTWGPIIHNQRVVNDLETQGITAVYSLDGIVPGVLVIRAHGAPPWVFAQAEARGFQVADATCPTVRKVQETVQGLTREGKQVVVVGRRGHPEVVGLCGWANDAALVVESPAEARALSFDQPVGVVAQTTQRETTFSQVVAVLEENADDLEVFPTICHATQARQDSALSLAREVDMMLVVGSRHSANTVQLAQVCRSSGIPVYHIEGGHELREEWFSTKRVIGIVAGASTPDVTIEEVKRVMTEFQRSEDHMESQEDQMESQMEMDNQMEEPAEGQPETEADNQVEGESFEDLYASAMRSLQVGEVIPGKVVRIDDDEVLVDVGYKSEGVIPLGELSDRHLASPEEEVSVGDEIKVHVLKVENSEGNPLLSKKRADYEDAWEELEEAFHNQEPVSGEVIQVVKGGLIIHLGLRAFLPASQVGLRYEPNLEKYVGQTLRVKVIEMERNRNKVIVSQKAVLEEELEAKKEALWQELAPDQVRRGTVTKLTDFGAFVDLGGIEGLVHISELSWARVKHPSEVLQEGDEIDVMVLGVDRERERVSLGLKQVLPDPWEGVSDRYPSGTVTEGTVTHIVGFGAFVQLEPGVEGLVHISQLANRRVGEPGEVVQVGDQVQVYILDVNEEERRISLSMKEVEQEVPEEEASMAPEAPEAEWDADSGEDWGATTETEPAAEEWEEPESEGLGGGVRIGEVLGDLLNGLGGNETEEASEEPAPEEEDWEWSLEREQDNEEEADEEENASGEEDEWPGSNI